MNNSPTQLTIMIVDDTAANLKLLDGMLRDQGYRVLAFPRGDLALAAAAKHHPDLILLDITMPEMDGFEVCTRLKADEALREVPVIFISALNETMDKVNAFKVGGVDYVTKPFQFEEVHARVETQLNLCRQRQALKDANTKLRKLESMRDSLVQMIVHDMRSPLTGINGYLELALLESLPPDLASDLTSARDCTVSLIEMVNSLLDVSKLESGKMALSLEEVDMGILVRAAAQMIAPLKKGRTLNLPEDTEESILLCDSPMIQRVVQNLMANAIKFTHKNDGVVSIRFETDRDWLRVFVTDNGPGIAAPYREDIFDKFFQVTAIQQGLARSTGLGLTFCKLAVEAHGGSITLDSEVGEGSTFRFELPRRGPVEETSS